VPGGIIPIVAVLAPFVHSAAFGEDGFETSQMTGSVSATRRTRIASENASEV